MTPRPQALLFDLDGTLIDSAPDLAGSANDMRIARGMAPLPQAQFRPMVGAGARGMIGVAMGIAPGDAGFEALRDEFLDIYARRLLNETRVFEAVEPVLREIEAMQVPWGIVTNKAHRYTTPVVEGLGLQRRAAAIVSGDTTPYAKPHPEPLFEAARRIGIAAAACIYVGDDFRDVQAGRAAGMKTVVAAWGYLGQGEPVSTWGADVVVDAPHQLLKSIGLA
jgi:2-phosphoglycolate phosphatase